MHVPGRVRLSHFPPLPWGHLGPAQPVGAKLEAIEESAAVVSQLETVMEELLKLHNSAPVQMRRHGALWLAVKEAFAGQIMAYPERYTAVSREHGPLLQHMRDSFHPLCKANSQSAHDLLMDWGSVIKKQFDIDNLPLRSKSTEGPLAIDRIVENLQSLGHNISRAAGRMSIIEQGITSIKGFLSRLNPFNRAQCAPSESLY